MSTFPIRMLVVGPKSPNTRATLEHLQRAGWCSHSTDSLREAETILKTIRFKVVLSAENLPDGNGHELASLVARQGNSLFISVALSESYLWLPVVEEGEKCLGKRAIDQQALENDVRALLGAPDREPASKLPKGGMGETPYIYTQLANDISNINGFHNSGGRGLNSQPHSKTDRVDRYGAVKRSGSPGRTLVAGHTDRAALGRLSEERRVAKAIGKRRTD
jgi:hypothetical protein